MKRLNPYNKSINSLKLKLFCSLPCPRMHNKNYLHYFPCIWNVYERNIAIHLLREVQTPHFSHTSVSQGTVFKVMFSIFSFLMEKCRLMRSPSCLCVCQSNCMSPINFSTNQQNLMKFGGQVMPFKVTSMR
jgi:hypothetical protein